MVGSQCLVSVAGGWLVVGGRWLAVGGRRRGAVREWQAGAHSKRGVPLGGVGPGLGSQPRGVVAYQCVNVRQAHR